MANQEEPKEYHERYKVFTVRERNATEAALRLYAWECRKADGPPSPVLNIAGSNPLTSLEIDRLADTLSEREVEGWRFY
jgi:hypothetical protein